MRVEPLSERRKQKEGGNGQREPNQPRNLEQSCHKRDSGTQDDKLEAASHAPLRLAGESQKFGGSDHLAC